MTQRYEVQTKFIYGFENVWRDEDDKLIYFDTREQACLLYTSPSPRDGLLSRMPSSA